MRTAPVPTAPMRTWSSAQARSSASSSTGRASSPGRRRILDHRATDRKIDHLSGARGSAGGAGSGLAGGVGCCSGGLGAGDGVAEGFELADVISGGPVFVDPGVVVAGAEVGISGGGVGEQVPDDDQDGAGGGDLGFGFAAAAGDAGVAFAQEGGGPGRADGGLAEVAAQVGVALAFAVAGARA